MNHEIMGIVFNHTEVIRPLQNVTSIPSNSHFVRELLGFADDGGPPAAGHHRA